VVERPTTSWRRYTEEQEAAVAAGTLDPDSCDAWALGLWPAGFTADADAALAAFERRIEQADLTGSHEVWVLIREVVLSLNAVDERWQAIETDEREVLCQYIDDALTAAGADLPAIASRFGIHRYDITDEWRKW
jgi:hypothetical protein